MARMDDLPLYTVVDDELYDELCELAGQKVVHIGVWEDSLGDALEPAATDPAQQRSFDLDVYLADGVYFELYSVGCYDSLDGEPWAGLDEVADRCRQLARQGLVLQEVAVDEEDALVLVLRYGQGQHLYLAVGAWLLEEWDELPGN